MKKDLIGILDLSVEDIDSLCTLAEDIIANPIKYSEKCKGKKIATLFYEPSTRTRLSFESAMLDLGGNVIGFSGAQNASVSKGESAADTSRVVECFADIIAMRHPLEGAPNVASLNVDIPVINAGDGGHFHPTQTLADMLTIHREMGHFDGLTIGCCGDLKYGRTVHSLLAAMSRYPGTKFVLISPDELKIPDSVRNDLESAGIPYVETKSLEDAIPELDILYMTRIQRERFDSLETYERLKDSYVLTLDKLQTAKKNMAILHPLPRVNEIAVDVDTDPRACYFKQVQNGKFIRMALILKLLERAEAVKTGKISLKMIETEAESTDKYTCTNPRCITSIEQGIKHKFIKAEDGSYRCAYCDAIAD